MSKRRRPRISLIINTACMDPEVAQGQNLYRVSTYGQRCETLRQSLSSLTSAGFDEIIVCGVFEEGEGYQYVRMAPRCRDRRDALHQRDLGAAYATGDILVFCHDDHIPGPGFVEELRAMSKDPGWALLVPKRLHGITGEELENGRSADYMGGHCLVMQRWLWAEVPWTSVDTEWWDVSMTRLWREAGGVIIHTDKLTHIDLEATECES